MRARMCVPLKKSRMPRNFRENHCSSPPGEKLMNGTHLILLHKALRRGLHPRTASLFGGAERGCRRRRASPIRLCYAWLKEIRWNTQEEAASFFPSLPCRPVAASETSGPGRSDSPIFSGTPGRNTGSFFPYTPLTPHRTTAPTAARRPLPVILCSSVPRSFSVQVFSGAPT